MASARRDPERAKLVSEFLKNQLRERDLTQAEFARRAGVVHPMVVRWLSGENLPNAQSCRRIADALGLPHWTVLELAGYADTESDRREGPMGHYTQQFRAAVADLDQEDVETVLMAVQSLAAGLRSKQRAREPAEKERVA